MELCLGTVQFGMNYGVFNQPKKDMDYCVKCLDYATQNGINAIDTATAYGIAEEVVGKFIRKKTINRNDIFISTKLLPNILDNYSSTEYKKIIIENLESSLKTIGTDYIDAYFLHSSRYVFDNEILEALQVAKEKGLAKEVGVSIYYNDEAKSCLNNTYIDYVQVPYSVFDRRMRDAGLFEAAADNKLKVDTRTTFVKGLIKLKEEEVPDYLSKAIPILNHLDNISLDTGLSRIELAIGYVKKEKSINHLVFGIRDMEQLKYDIEAFSKELPEDIYIEMDKAFKNIDTDIIVPSLWKR